MRSALVIVQVLTFVALGVMLIIQRDWRLGLAQLLLAGVQGLIYA
jgi:hypothetical protein